MIKKILTLILLLTQFSYAGINITNKIDPTFISTWKTDNLSTGSSNNNQVKLPLVASGTYAMNVDWGDGRSNYITAYNQAEVTHTYSIAGTYTVKISGTCTGWQFIAAGDRLKLLNISKWGSFRLGNTGSYFYGCTNLTITATDILDLTGTTSLSFCFSGCSNITTIPSMGSWNTSNIINLRNAFSGCLKFNESGIKYINVSNVTDLYRTFQNCPLFNQDLNNWSTSNVTTLHQTFEGCAIFNGNIENWNTIKVTEFYYCFLNAVAFNQNLGGWNITALTNASNMFLGVALSKTNYNALLAGWGAQTVKTGVAFSGGNSHYDSTTGGYDGTAGRASLVSQGWTISDSGTP